MAKLRTALAGGVGMLCIGCLQIALAQNRAAAEQVADIGVHVPPAVTRSVMLGHTNPNKLLHVMSQPKSLSTPDQLKIVICDRRDYHWAKAKMEEYGLAAYCEVLLSPSSGQMDPALLADWILQDRLRVRFQIQLHKYLWGDTPGR